MQQQIKAQHMGWGQGCSPIFVVKTFPLRSNSALLQVTPFLLHTVFDSAGEKRERQKDFFIKL